MIDEKEIARLRARYVEYKEIDATPLFDEVERFRGETTRLQAAVVRTEGHLQRAEKWSEERRARAEKAEAERDAATKVAAEYHAHTRALMDFVDHLVKHQEAHKIPMPLHFINQVMAARTSAEVYALIDNARAGR